MNIPGTPPEGTLSEEIRRLLLKKALRETLTPAEEAQLESWVQISGERRKILDELLDARFLTNELASLDHITDHRVFEKLNAFLESVEERPVRRIRSIWTRYAAAAIVLGIAVISYLYFSSNKDTGPVAGKQEAAEQKSDVLPGRKGAVLTLADGRMIVLDSLGNGVIADEKGASVILDNNQITYKASGLKPQGAELNTMSTPRGRQFMLSLPDGSKIWLNAASSITYPTVFSGNRREVFVTGEAYFEVAEMAGKPFIVNVNNSAKIEVLGTSFNVNCYEDEHMIRTTLVMGSVKVTVKPGSENRATRVTILKPGQQAQARPAVVPSGGMVSNVSVVEADVEKVMAWKNGYFNFDDVGLRGVMREISRWYDIEVVYEKGVPEIYFAGELSRNVSLSGLLKGLEGAGVHFRLDGERRLIVLP